MGAVLNAFDGNETPAASSEAASPTELDAFTLRLAGRGDARACRALVSCYQRRVYGLISRMLQGRERAVVDDLAQEVFLRVFKHLPGFDPEGSAKLSTWIYRVATRLCIDELRRRRARGSDDELESLAQDLSANPESQAERARLRLALMAALADLNGEQRAAFVLYEFHAQSYADIAEVLELPLGTVRSRIARARKALQLSLAKEGEAFLPTRSKGTNGHE